MPAVGNGTGIPVQYVLSIPLRVTPQATRAEGCQVMMNLVIQRAGVIRRRIAKTILFVNRENLLEKRVLPVVSAQKRRTYTASTINAVRTPTRCARKG